MATIKSIEEKAKAYDEALEKARQLCAYPTSKPFIGDLQDLFPELKESEDEMMRKDIVEAVELHKGFTQERKEYIYDWLEKQGEQKMKTPEESLGIESDTYSKIVDECIYGEQKPAWSEEDKTVLNNLIYALANDRIGNDRDEYISWLNSLKDRVQPKQEWSEEDKKLWVHDDDIILDAAKMIVEDSPRKSYGGVHKKKIVPWFYSLKERLKSLRPQNTWKPSDEQMKALNYVVNLMASSERPTENDLYYNILKSLREQLLKLREE